MTPTRRRFHALLAASTAAALTLLTGTAQAQFPEKSVKLVVPYPPGGATDILARGLAAGMSKELGQSVVIENKPGANTKIATVAVSRAPADGYTLLLASSASLVLNPMLYRQIGYSPSDFRLLDIVAEAPLVVVTNAQVPARNLQEFTAYAKAHAGRINYASVGLGNPLHLATEMLKSALQIEATHIPYQGSVPALTSLMANDTQLMIDAASTSLPQIRAGKLRALAVTGSERLKDLPDVPTVAETATPGFQAALWFGVALPAATPPALADRLQAAVRTAMADPQYRTLLEQRSLLPQPSRSDAELRQHVERDRATWGRVIREHNIVLDDAGG
ncbi:MAG: tripartite tricarboxylate transporter substrate binding protein [Rubrivivax sp.]